MNESIKESNIELLKTIKILIKGKLPSIYKNTKYESVTGFTSYEIKEYSNGQKTGINSIKIRLNHKPRLRLFKKDILNIEVSINPTNIMTYSTVIDGKDFPMELKEIYSIILNNIVNDDTTKKVNNIKKVIELITKVLPASEIRDDKLDEILNK